MTFLEESEVNEDASKEDHLVDIASKVVSARSMRYPESTQLEILSPFDVMVRPA